MTWSIIGLVLTAAVSLLAWSRLRAPAGFYDGDVYGMTPEAHRRYFVFELALVASFVATLILRANATAVWLLAVAVVTDVFYVTSFLRGASEDE